MSHRATEGRRQLSGAYLQSATLSRAADVIGSIAVPAAFAYNLIVPQLQSARRQSVARRCAADAFDWRRRRCRRDPVSRTRQGASAALRPSPYPQEMSVRSGDRAVPSPRGGSAGSRWPLTSLNGPLPRRVPQRARVPWLANGTANPGGSITMPAGRTPASAVWPRTSLQPGLNGTTTGAASGYQ
jgi:hypothetical protein